MSCTGFLYSLKYYRHRSTKTQPYTWNTTYHPCTFNNFVSYSHFSICNWQWLWNPDGRSCSHHLLLIYSWVWRRFYRLVQGSTARIHKCMSYSSQHYFRTRHSSHNCTRCTYVVRSGTLRSILACTWSRSWSRHRSRSSPPCSSWSRSVFLW